MSQGSVLGHEYSGRDWKGKRVCGMIGGGELATTVLADRLVMFDVPDYWTLEQASTVSRVYSVVRSFAFESFNTLGFELSLRFRNSNRHITH